jgi:O-methyltransferase
MVDDSADANISKSEKRDQWRHEKLMARLEKIEKKVDYATLKIRGKTEDTVAPTHIIAPHMVWLHEPFFVSAKARVKQPGIPDIRCFFLQSCLRSIANVAGDVAECGVREGKSALFMLEALNAPRDFFLFDSFEGLSDPVAGKDTLQSAIDAASGKRIFAGDIDKVRQTFAVRPNVHVMAGWIPERFAEVAERQFALVHIDVDLYEPTLASISFFYPRLERHGILICDDYGSGAYPGARRAMDEFFAEKTEKPIELPQGQAFVIKR